MPKAIPAQGGGCACKGQLKRTGGVYLSRSTGSKNVAGEGGNRGGTCGVYGDSGKFYLCFHC